MFFSHMRKERETNLAGHVSHRRPLRLSTVSLPLNTVYSHLVGVYHCEGTARTVGLELLPQLMLPLGRRAKEEEDGRNQSHAP